MSREQQLKLISFSRMSSESVKSVHHPEDEMIRTRNAIERDDDEWNLNQNGMQAVRTVLSAV